MSKDIECPYCEAEQDIIHDDGQGYDQDRLNEQQCNSCEKYFVFSTVISYDYYPEKADCLNGSSHIFEPVTHFPRVFPDWVRCTVCEKEERGKLQELEVKNETK